MTVHVIGAGMAGLLAGAMFRGDGQLYEAAPSLPNNHHALLRFRSDAIAQYLNIQFRAVDVIKCTRPWRNPVADAISYSLKCTGKASLRSSITADGKVSKRFIADQKFIADLARHQSNPILFDQQVDEKWLGEMAGDRSPVISTMPMPTLMRLLDYDRVPLFGSCEGMVIRAVLPMESDVCATIYYPDPQFGHTRATLTDHVLQIEVPLPWAGPNAGAHIDSLQDRPDATYNSFVAPVLEDFGVDHLGKPVFSIHRQKYAKIMPIDEFERKRFIMWATDQFGIYSLGRFATWRPGLLLDDVFHDVQHIQTMLAKGNYHRRIK